ncbi:MAG: hypothetical protein PQJ50_09300 [Spirochaetales bacterium]|nr:hypothetical protein [Spirochaetales bacterium]
MKGTRFPASIWLLPAVILTVMVLPVLIWFLASPVPASVVIYGPGERDGARMKALSWPAEYRKGEVSAFPSGRNRGTGTFILETAVPSGAGDEEAIRAISRIKDVALKNRTFICDGHLLTERVHPLFRKYLEDFLQVRFSGWTVLYSRSEEPELRYFHTDGRSFVLKGDDLFSGMAPTADTGGRKAPVYSWISIYQPAGSSVSTSWLDLHLTEKGRSVLETRDIPADIPLIIESNSPLVNTSFFTLDISRYPVDGGGFRIAGKMFFKSRISLYVEDGDEAVFWRCYVPWVDGLLKGTAGAPESGVLRTAAFSSDESRFYRTLDGVREEFFVKGVNLGPALPGTWGTQFPRDEHLYYRWLTEMKEMNFNSLRIYTLLPPAFYRAFRNFNDDNPESPVYLIQEIWPEEHPENNNYLGANYNRIYQEEIRHTIDALHGRGDIPYRTGRAWGQYTADVTPWLMSWLIGREMEPDEVLDTNALNSESVYQGEYISAPAGPAVEAWLAESCDQAVSYELSRYGETRPVGIVSWPILDVLHHEVEWRDPELMGRAPHNDKAVVDIRNITVESGEVSGFFGAYHIYPNYPDFMNNRTSFAGYRDDQGVFRYGGYLKEFMTVHSGYPAIVAEYGISTSAATAHISPDGYHHGGLSEEKQAEGIIRMTDAIVREGYAGALIFEWIDEWQKKTWTTEPFMIPYDRQALWHNVLDPEQNYGIRAMRADSVMEKGVYQSSGTGDPEITAQLEWWGSESHLYLQLHPGSSGIPEKGRVLFGFDSIDHDRGIVYFPGNENHQTPTGMESMISLDLENGEARFLAASDYNIARYSYKSGSSGNPGFEEIRVLVNRESRTERWGLIPALYANWSTLNTGPMDEAGNSVETGGDRITLRIPWGLLNVSDPSSGMVLDDGGVYRGALLRDQLTVSESPGIRIYCVLEDEEGHQLLPREFGDPGFFYPFTQWDVPRYREEEKKSIPLLRRYFGEL